MAGITWLKWVYSQPWVWFVSRIFHAIQAASEASKKDTRQNNPTLSEK